MADSSSTTTVFTYGKQGAKLGALIALGYYLVVVAVLAAVTSADAGELLSTTPIVTFFSFAVLGLIVGLPAMLVAISLGFITGLAIPKLLAIVGPRNRWQSALAGVVFSGAIALSISWLLGFPSEIVMLVEVPLLVYVAATTYLSIGLSSNKDAVKKLLPEIEAHPIIIWLVAAGFVTFILYILTYVISAWF